MHQMPLSSSTLLQIPHRAFSYAAGPTPQFRIHKPVSKGIALKLCVFHTCGRLWPFDVHLQAAVHWAHDARLAAAPQVAPLHRHQLLEEIRLCRPEERHLGHKELCSEGCRQSGQRHSQVHPWSQRLDTLRWYLSMVS